MQKGHLLYWFALAGFGPWLLPGCCARASDDALSKSPAITPEVISTQPTGVAGLTRSMQWSPNGGSIAFIQEVTAEASAKTPPALEISAIDAATGNRKVLVGAKELASAIPSTATNDKADDDDAPQPDHLRYFAWGARGRAILLAAKYSLAWFDLEDHGARTLVSGRDEISDAKISPDGKRVAFVRHHALWTVATAGGEAKLLSKPPSEDRREGEADWAYGKEFGMRSAYWWSPDSTAIAYMEFDDRKVAKYHMRKADGTDRILAYPQPGSAVPAVRVYVKPLAGDKTMELNLGDVTAQYLPRIQWTPDGRYLAIERLSRDQKSLDLLMVDRLEGRVRALLTEKDDYWINVSDNLFFLNDSKRFVWASERTGHRHLYLYDVEGHQISQLTGGEWEVSSLDGVDEAKHAVYFTATRQSALDREIYRVGLDGAGLTQITEGPGTHEARFAPGAQKYVDMFSDVGTPPRPSLHSADGGLLAAIGADEVDRVRSLHLNPVEFFTFKTHMGDDLNALLIKPPHFDSANKYPVIVYVAGGPGEQVVRRMWGGDTFLWLQSMAQRGYLIFAVDNHGTSGRGHLFEEPIHLRFSSQEMADQRDGTHYLRSLPYVDKERIGIFGWGFGGFLTLHGMLDVPIIYKAGIAGAPVSDWKFYDAIFSERYLKDPVRNQDGWLASSPVENAKNLKTPLLIAQGTGDETVHIENTLTLLSELMEKGKSADVLLLPDCPHVPEDPQSKLTLYRKLTEFFLKNL